MPLGILPSGLIGDVASPSKVLVMLPSGLVSEAAWGSAGALEVLASGLVGQASAGPVILTTSPTVSVSDTTARIAFRVSGHSA